LRTLFELADDSRAELDAYIARAREVQSSNSRVAAERRVGG
jgi:hypothetical protein